MIKQKRGMSAWIWILIILIIIVIAVIVYFVFFSGSDISSIFGGGIPKPPALPD